MMILLLWADVWGMETIRRVTWRGKPGWLVIESSLSHATGSFAAMALLHSLCPTFCRSEPQVPTSTTGCPRTQKTSEPKWWKTLCMLVLMINIQNVTVVQKGKTLCMHTHKHTYHEKNFKMVPYRGTDDISIYAFELNWALGVSNR